MSSIGRVFNIQKFSIHDGPGIRTTVFLKGCPLRCQWCSNPEGIDRSPTLSIDMDKCLTSDVCGRCLDACPPDALGHDKTTLKVSIDRSICDFCRNCVSACPTKAFEVFGTNMTAEQVMSIVEQDDLFYSSSGGGLTLSGGEPLFQPSFARTLLKMAHSSGIDTAIETSGYAHLSDVVKVIKFCDFIYYDIKTMDTEKHKLFTGIDNSTILSNLEKVCELFPKLPIYVRTPVIPGFNDNKEDIKEILHFLSTLPRKVEYELLPYHQFGVKKYSTIGKEYQKPRFNKCDRYNYANLNKLF